MKCAIEKLPFVTVLSPVRAVKGKGRGYGVTLRCPSCEEYGSCGKKQEPPVQVSSVHPTELACLQELLKRLQDRHVDCTEAVAKKAAADAASAATVDPDAPNVLQAMMQLQQAKSRAEAANKLALEAETERDAAEKAVEELKRQLQPKRPRTDNDAGDAHEVLAEVENWDLRDHRQQATRVQNRRNVQLGSRQNQAQPRAGTDGFLHHKRLGLVGWIAYWCLGARRHEDSAGCCDVSPRSRNQPTTSTPYRFSMQGHHVMFFFYVSWCTEALCEEVVQLLVHGMLACAWPRTRIQVLWTESHGGRLYAHQADLLDRRRIYCHSIIRDSES